MAANQAETGQVSFAQRSAKLAGNGAQRNCQSELMRLLGSLSQFDCITLTMPRLCIPLESEDQLPPPMLLLSITEIHHDGGPHVSGLFGQSLLYFRKV